MFPLSTTDYTDLRLEDFPEHQHKTLRESVFAPEVLPHDVVDMLKPVIQAVGLTRLSLTHSYLQVHRQVQKRLVLIDEIRNDLRKRERETNEYVLEQAFQEDVFDYLVDLQRHTDYVLRVNALLDIYNTIDHASVLTASELCSEWRKYVTEWTAKENA